MMRISVTFKIPNLLEIIHIHFKFVCEARETFFIVKFWWTKKKILFESLQGSCIVYAASSWLLKTENSSQNEEKRGRNEKGQNKFCGFSLYLNNEIETIKRVSRSHSYLSHIYSLVCLSSALWQNYSKRAFRMQDECVVKEVEVVGAKN